MIHKRHNTPIDNEAQSRDPENKKKHSMMRGAISKFDFEDLRSNIKIKRSTKAKHGHPHHQKSILNINVQNSIFKVQSSIELVSRTTKFNFEYKS